MCRDGKMRWERKRYKRSPATPTIKPAMNATITTTTAVVRVLLGEVVGISVNSDLHEIGRHRFDAVRTFMPPDPGHAERCGDRQRHERGGDRPEPSRQHHGNAGLTANAFANPGNQTGPEHVVRHVSKTGSVFAQSVEKLVFTH